MDFVACYRVRKISRVERADICCVAGESMSQTGGVAATSCLPPSLPHDSPHSLADPPPPPPTSNISQILYQTDIGGDNVISFVINDIKRQKLESCVLKNRFIKILFSRKNLPISKKTSKI